ncbi:MAG: hypothetical protein LUD78_02060 [Clostridiales bacterium]|nr:hypothetical protein [Clostridiales bacterium]
MTKPVFSIFHSFVSWFLYKITREMAAFPSLWREPELVTKLKHKTFRLSKLTIRRGKRKNDKLMRRLKQKILSFADLVTKREEVVGGRPGGMWTDAGVSA